MFRDNHFVHWLLIKILIQFISGFFELTPELKKQVTKNYDNEEVFKS